MAGFLRSYCHGCLAAGNLVSALSRLVGVSCNVGSGRSLLLHNV